MIPYLDFVVLEQCVYSNRVVYVFMFACNRTSRGHDREMIVHEAEANARGQPIRSACMRVSRTLVSCSASSACDVSMTMGGTMGD